MFGSGLFVLEIDFLKITTADFSQKKTTIFYKSVIRTRFKDFTLPKDAIINAYQLEPMNNFVFFSVETLFLENLFQAQINQTQTSTPLESKKIKELHKTLHKSFFLKCEKNWNQFFRKRLLRNYFQKSLWSAFYF